MQANNDDEINAIVATEVWQLMYCSGFNAVQITTKNRSEAAQVAIVHDTLLKRKGELDDIRLRMQEIKDFLGRDLLDYLDKHDLDVPSLFPK